MKKKESENQTYQMNHQRLRFAPEKMLVNFCKTLSISGLILYVFFIYFSKNSSSKPSECTFPVKHIWEHPQQILHHQEPVTNITHLVFGISGSVDAWQNRQSYFQSWWRPNVTRGYIFFDKVPMQDFPPWPAHFPPLRVSEDTTKFEVYKRHVKPNVIRIVRSVLEMFREGDEGVRWYVMGDDDTIFFIDNLVDLLGKYDHTKYFYIGGISECTKSNYDFSFEMAFGGGGYALSYPLVAALVKNLDNCINIYPFYHVSDQILSACIADLGVPLTPEKGFHQIDLVQDISGFLSAHPQSPLITLHHLDIPPPIFPSMERHQSVDHLMKAAIKDQSRMLQQTVCYYKKKNWSFSIAWGYSAYIYEQFIPRSILRRPLETFIPWTLKPRPPDYMFNTRFVSNHPCEAPHLFFLESVEENMTLDQVITIYVRSSPRNMPPCSVGGKNSADHINKILVFSSPRKLKWAENRGECCDVIHVDDAAGIAKVRLRACWKTEIVA